MKNIFSIDLEDWYHSYYEGRAIATDNYRIVQPTEQILNLLKKTHNTATFFVVGEIAQRHPQLIKKISAAGHEIACHSLHHQFIHQMTATQFETDLSKLKSLLVKLTGKKIVGYRAPAWSADKQKTPWFWSILKKHGFCYSSSVFPVKNFLYGDPTSPRFPHQIDRLTEIPASTVRILNHNFGFSGGFYLRLLPLPLIKIATSYLNTQKQPVVFYIHPREIDPGQPHLKLPLAERFIHYYNLNHTFSKLKNIFENHRLVSFQKFYRL